MRGFIICSWDNKIGAVLKAKISMNIEIKGKDLISIYTFHSMEGLQTGFLTIKRKDLNFASYFLNIETPEKKRSNFIIILIIN